MKVSIEAREVTVEQFLAVVKHVVNEHPTYRNPWGRSRSEGGGTSCMYRRVADDGTVRRCLIGHVLVEEFGLEYTSGWEFRGAGTIMKMLGFADDVWFQGDELQSHADKRVDTLDDDSDRVTWVEAWDAYTRSRSFELRHQETTW